MEKIILVYATNINKTGETGLVAIENNVPRTYCFCNEETANEILAMKAEIEELKRANISLQSQNSYLEHSNILKM